MTSHYTFSMTSIVSHELSISLSRNHNPNHYSYGLKSGGYASSLKDTNQLLPICLLSYKELPTQFLTDMLGMPMRPLQLYLESPEQEYFIQSISEYLRLLEITEYLNIMPLFLKLSPNLILGQSS